MLHAHESLTLAMLLVQCWWCDAAAAWMLHAR